MCLGLGLCFVPRWRVLASQCSIGITHSFSVQDKTYWKQEIPLIPLNSPGIFAPCEITDWNCNHLITGMAWTLGSQILPESNRPEPGRLLGLCIFGFITSLVTWCFALGVRAEHHTHKCVGFPQFAYLIWLKEAEKGQQTYPQLTAHLI